MTLLLWLLLAALPLGRPDLAETRSSRPVAPGIEYTEIRRGNEFAIYVLEADLSRCRAEVVLGRGRQKLEDLARGSLAAVNGGYFVMEPADGFPGEPAGVCMLAGDLVSEAVNGRTALILRDGRAQIAQVDTFLTVLAPDAAREIDGVNRPAGKIRSGGGVGDRPTDHPQHDRTATDPDELILFNRDLGLNDRVLEMILHDGLYVHYLDGGRRAVAGNDPWLREHSRAPLEVRVEITADGLPLVPTGDTWIVNGGPRLLRHGEVDIPAYREGFHHLDDPMFYFHFGVNRQPRTAAGITREGKLLLVVIDGRQPGWSLGASFEETALVMRELGAVEAVNLDGGGSSTMTIGDRVVNRPSDAGGRAIGDAIVLLPLSVR